MLPYFQSKDQELNKLQTQWGSQLNPLLGSPIVNGILLQGVSLSTGTNVINHKLGRNLVGWIITRRRANATVYDTQDTNQTPQLTLQLTASGAVVVDLYVF